MPGGDDGGRAPGYRPPGWEPPDDTPGGGNDSDDSGGSGDDDDGIDRGIGGGDDSDDSGGSGGDGGSGDDSDDSGGTPPEERPPGYRPPGWEPPEDIPGGDDDGDDDSGGTPPEERPPGYRPPGWEPPEDIPGGGDDGDDGGKSSTVGWDGKEPSVIPALNNKTVGEIKIHARDNINTEANKRRYQFDLWNPTQKTRKTTVSVAGMTENVTLGPSEETSVHFTVPKSEFSTESGGSVDMLIRDDTSGDAYDHRFINQWDDMENDGLDGGWHDGGGDGDDGGGESGNDGGGWFDGDDDGENGNDGGGFDWGAIGGDDSTQTDGGSDGFPVPMLPAIGGMTRTQTTLAAGAAALLLIGVIL